MNILEGEQFDPDFLKIAPNNRIPAIIDHAPAGGSGPVSVFESGAILIYLAEETGKFLPKDGPARYDVLQWLMWQMGGIALHWDDVLRLTAYVRLGAVGASLMLKRLGRLPSTERTGARFARNRSHRAHSYTLDFVDRGMN